MADDKLRQELFYMVRLTSKYDFSKMEVVEGILRLESERQILGSVFGKRFKARIFDIAASVNTDDSCVICGQTAFNKVICNHCMETIGGSEYAKSKAPSIKEQKSRKAVSITKLGFIKNILKTLCIVCLVVILFFQIWVLSLWININKEQPIEEARVSQISTSPVASETEAYNQLILDFPEDEGYTVSFSRMDRDYVGRFLLSPGDCCEDVEEELTDEERYDYFFSEDVYVFSISYYENYVPKIGIAEINSDGAIIIMGVFNDGRKTNCHYKFR